MSSEPPFTVNGVRERSVGFGAQLARILRRLIEEEMWFPGFCGGKTGSVGYPGGSVLFGED